MVSSIGKFNLKWVVSGYSPSEKVKRSHNTLLDPRSAESGGAYAIVGGRGRKKGKEKGKKEEERKRVCGG
jgi:hypothetical protein